MGKQGIICLLLCAALGFGGCAETVNQPAAGVSATENTVSEPSIAEAAAAAGTAQPETAETVIFTDRDLDPSYEEGESIAIVLEGTGISCASENVAVSGTTVTIQKEGTYLLTGTLEDGSVIVDGDKTDKIQLVLGGVSIHSESSAPIYVRQADKVFVTLAEGTQNSLSNGGSFTPDGDTNVDGVIFSRDDLTLNGSGALTITSPAGHGIVSKDSLRITGGTYAIDAEGHGLSGKDEVSIASGSFEILSGKDGIHGENDEDESFVYLENGAYRITAGGDGVSASGSCRIVDGEYTITTGGGSDSAPERAANQSFGRGERGGEMPADRGQDFPERGTGEKGGMGGKNLDRMNPPQEPPAGQEPTAAEAGADTVSTKGIKAGSLTIEDGSFHIDSADDGLHANGSLLLLGGAFEIASGDDGIHADETVTIVSGTVNITRSYEGIEGKHLLIQGGEITLTADDDGLNAAGGMDGSGFGWRGDAFNQSGDTPSIVISGGSVEITASGDGIDANGTLEITGGAVTVSGPDYGDTSVLDYDVSGRITGGTFVGTGSSGMSQSFSDSTQGVISESVGTQSGGTTITLKDAGGKTLMTRTPDLDFSMVILSAPEIQPGEEYTLQIGDAAMTVIGK